MPFLRDALASDPGSPAVDDAAGVWSYGDLDREADGVAGGLLSAGLEVGDVVALDGALDRHYLACIHGVWRAEGVVAPLNEKWTDREKTEALRELAPRFFLNDPPAETSQWIGDRISHAPPSVNKEGDEIAALLLTSGTTGRPRMVQLSFKNLRASAMASKDRLGLSAGDRWFGSLSPAHVGGIALIARAALLRSVLVLRGPFEVGTFVDLLRDGAIGFASLVPTMLHRTLEAWGDSEIPESLRCLLIGGASAPPDLVRAATSRGFPLALTYGLTEASSQVATAPPVLVREKPGTVGPPLSGVEVRVAESGEIVVKGATVAAGQAEPDGWLHTGDLGRMDEDGHLWVTGRLSDRIITGGVNVEPLEVERVLEALPWVEEAAVVGIPDREWGETVVAAIVVTELGASVQRDELDRHVRAELSPAKRPREFRAVGHLPRNRNGKLDRETVRALFL
jgi:O-succinylbenzoic acid--CoA ligase